MLELLPASVPLHPPAPSTTLPFARDKVTSLFTAAEALLLHHPPGSPLLQPGKGDTGCHQPGLGRAHQKQQKACGLHHLQRVHPQNCSFYTSGLLWGFNRWRETFQARRLCPQQFLSTQTWSVVVEVSQVLLRGGSRLGRAASLRVRRGAGRCSRWPTRRARSHGAGTSLRLLLWRCPRLSLGSPAGCWQSPWQR